MYFEIVVGISVSIQNFTWISYSYWTALITSSKQSTAACASALASSEEAADSCWAAFSKPSLAAYNCSGFEQYKCKSRDYEKLTSNMSAVVYPWF